MSQERDPARFSPSGRPRAAGLGLRFPGVTGRWNAITDVPGVCVGYTTLIAFDGPLVVGRGPVRTGVTALLPRPREASLTPVFAGLIALNGNGEMTGSHFIAECGRFALPIVLTNTHSCGLARDAVVKWAAERFADQLKDDFALPVAAETYDGFLNDINGFHVTDGHVHAAIDGAVAGPIEEGSVGGGTGMKCFGFKAGSGTASRRVAFSGRDYMVGLFVQANFGAREDLVVRGAALGERLVEPRMIRNTPDPAGSSIIAIAATDAPLLPHQLARLARRIGLGMARTGGLARHGSGDIFLAFSTATPRAGFHASEALLTLDCVPDEALDPFFIAVVQVTEEAILNSLAAAHDMTGRDGNFVPALPHDALIALAQAQNRSEDGGWSG